MDPGALVVPLVCGDPSPQLIPNAQGPSFAPSVNEALRVAGLPTLTVCGGPAFTTGAAFAMVALVETGALDAPRVSVTVSVTV